jgi:hypothetical protein
MISWTIDKPPGSLGCAIAGLEWLDAVAVDACGGAAAVVSNRHAIAIEICHDALGSARVDQRVADQVGQGAAHRRLDALHDDGCLRSLL